MCSNLLTVCNTQQQLHPLWREGKFLQMISEPTPWKAGDWTACPHSEALPKPLRGGGTETLETSLLKILVKLTSVWSIYNLYLYVLKIVLFVTKYFWMFARSPLTADGSTVHITHYFSENLIAAGIEPGTSGTLATRPQQRWLWSTNRSAVLLCAPCVGPLVTQVTMKSQWVYHGWDIHYTMSPSVTQFASLISELL
jgi:hypothetical protein